VINKAALINGTLTYTAFWDASGDCSVSDHFRPQGVDNYDALAVGYVIYPDECANPLTQLKVRQVNNPGSTPTLSAPIIMSLPMPEKSPIGGVKTKNNNCIAVTDDGQRNLYNAVLRNGHLWTAHTVGINLQGNSSGTPDRDAIRWYDINVSNWKMNQWGTIFDNVTPSTGLPNQYWMGSIMVSGLDIC